MAREVSLPYSIEPHAFRVKDFCQIYGIGKTKFYQEVSEGRLSILKIGRRTLVSRESARRWLQDLQTRISVYE
jgi:excisionase family DNA binding protein